MGVPSKLPPMKKYKVTTRQSRGFYLNRVELLNGFLAVAHSNLFIPSTLGGAGYSEKGLDNDNWQKS